MSQKHLPAGAASSCANSEWDDLVAGHERATLYHTWRWSQYAGDAFGFDVHRVARRDAQGRLTGVLPLVLQRSAVFGRRLVSMPFFNYGGPLGTTAGEEESLIDDATRLARGVGARVLELRDVLPRPGRVVRTDKATVELALPDSTEVLAKQLGAKLRSQIRRADRESPEVLTGGGELVADFYSVFAVTMRDLGTPVYPRRFFDRMLEQLAADCTVIVIRLQGQVAAAALLTHFRDRTEIPWAASRHELRATSVNMRLYWECLSHAINRGSRVFDFGRSTVDAGTYRFKLQWGGTARPLYWTYPLEVPVEAGPGGAAGGGLKARAQSLWSRLPLAVTNRIGPLVSPGLPW